MRLDAVWHLFTSWSIVTPFLKWLPPEAVHCLLTQLALGVVQRGESSVIIMDPQPEMEPGNIVITSDDAQAAYDGTSEAALAQVRPCIKFMIPVTQTILRIHMRGNIVITFDDAQAANNGSS